LFDAKPASRIVLAPGMLSALRHLFSAMHLDRVVLTSDEYYSARHFPTNHVDVVTIPTLVDRVKALRPGAVIVSVVSWKGRPLPVSELFGEIRRSLRARAPLLIADYTHAGAVGFPPVSALEADVVSGDPEKWLLPAGQTSRLAFLWMRSSRLFQIAQRSFAPFFLGVEGESDGRSARWIDPEELHAVAKWLAEARLTRRMLVDRHDANMRMKQRLGQTLGIDAGGPASVLWTDRRIPKALQRRLNRRGLLWRADGHTRILCRSEG
jgi:selenocysteine lyase/cysteine desulfurase